MPLAKKIIGFSLLAAGILLIGWTVYASYNIFTGKAEAPTVFEVEKTLSQTKTGATQDLQAQMQEMVAAQFAEMMPADFMQKTFNLVSWSIFAGILIFAAGQISGIGIKLLG